MGERPALAFLECRASPRGAYAAAILFERGFYYLGRWDGRSLTRLTPLLQSPSARLRNAGVDLALTCAGSNVTLAINGQEAATVRDTTYPEGTLRIGAAALEGGDRGTFDVRFDNLVVTQAALVAEPTRSPTATATPTIAPAVAAPPATRTPTPVPLSEADVTARVAPSVVQVVTRSGSGSGVRVAQGVLTNDHVVAGQQEVEVISPDGSRQAAAVVRTDPWFDLALLTTDADISALDVEPTGRQRQGDPMLVLGYPLAPMLAGSATVTRGILSAVREMEGVTLVQTDAAMNPGNSGGAMVNMRGKLIGISARELSTGGLNLGIAGESIQAFLDGAQIVAADPSEPDNNVKEAHWLTVGAYPEARSLHAPGDVDWVSFAVGAGQSVVLFTDSPSCDTYLRLFAPDGATLLDEDDDGGPNVSSWIEFTADVSGVYYGRVSHVRPRGTCRSYHVGVHAG